MCVHHRPTLIEYACDVLHSYYGMRITVNEVAIPPAAVWVKIIYPAAGWITSYWPGKENYIQSRCQFTYSCFRVRFNIFYYQIQSIPKSKVHNAFKIRDRPISNPPVQLDLTNPTLLLSCDLTTSLPKLTWPNPIQQCPTLPYPITPVPIPP